MKFVFSTLIIAIAVLIGGSASAQLRRDLRPVLYPNKHFNQVGQARANQDIAQCSAQATNYLKNSSQTGDGAKNVAGSAVKGAILGTVGGAIMGNTGRGAAAGAVVGGTSSVVNGVDKRGTRDPIFQQYANSCLEDKGYKVIEWR